MAILVDPIAIEPMRPTDVALVIRIEERCYPTLWHAGAYFSELANRSAVYIVARYDAQLVGYAGMWVVAGEAHITTIAVHPDHQGRKIGQRLLHALLDQAIQRGADSVNLEVREHNVKAQKLYQKYGFRPGGVRRAYYNDNDENAIVMFAQAISGEPYREFLDQLRTALYNSYYEHFRPGDKLR